MNTDLSFHLQKDSGDGLTSSGIHAVVSNESLFLQKVICHCHITGLQVDDLQANEYNILHKIIVTARKRSLRRLCFYTCLSVRGGGGVRGGGWGMCMAGGIHGWWGACMAGGVCMAGGGACVAGGHAWHACPHPRQILQDTVIRSMSGRYASYWNAFLLKWYFRHCNVIFKNVFTVEQHEILEIQMLADVLAKKKSFTF